MIKELRIGNYIQIGNIITKVEGISSWDNMVLTDSFADRDIKEFEPIPLTEEWLVKFGFYKNHHGEFVNEETKYQFNVFQNMFYACSETSDVTLCDVLFVHSLQNLYYFLTGEELVIK